jgi:hypothetical protein
VTTGLLDAEYLTPPQRHPPLRIGIHHPLVPGRQAIKADLLRADAERRITRECVNRQSGEEAVRPFKTPAPDLSPRDHGGGQCRVIHFTGHAVAIQ